MTATTLEIIVPYQAGAPERANNLRWVLDRMVYIPDVTVAEIPVGQPWVKANAVNPAVKKSKARLVAIHDADVWVPGLLDAVIAVLHGAPWAIPHTNVHRFTQAATTDILNGAAPTVDMPTVERPYPGVRGGGCVVIPRKTATEIPLDPRFEGWGGEDHSWGYALTALVGEPWRSEDPLFHLWHPIPPRTSRKLGSYQTEQLRRKYRDAMIFAADMETLVGSIPR